MQDNDPQLAAMASAESPKDLEPGLSSSRNEIIQEKDQTSLFSVRRGPPSLANSSKRRPYGLWASIKMSSFRRTILTLLIVVFLTAVTYAAVPVVRKPQDLTHNGKDTSFQDLLNSVSDASLHEVLTNVYKKYRHGVFPEDRTAMKAVHDDDAVAATSLVELARRQNTNVTSATVSDSSTATVVIVSTTETDTIIQTSGTDSSVVVVNTQTTVTSVPTTATTDNLVQTTTTQVSSNPPSGPSSFVPTPSQSVNSSIFSAVTSASSSLANTTNQANPTSSPQVPDQAPTDSGASSGPGTTAPSSPPTTLVTTSSSTFTFTSSSEAAGSTSGAAGVTTAKSSSTEQIKFTTTLPDGSQSTVTSFTIVPAGDQASTAGAAGATGTSSGTPGLQNGAVEGNQPRGMGVVGSLVAALIFVIGIL